MAKVKEVASNSIAAELGLEAGDRLLTVNTAPVRDFLDLFLAEQQEDLLLVIEKHDGDVWELEIEKESGESLGLALDHGGPKQCGNNCVFCFVHQLPKGMRRTLYIKDEDFRFSYIYGAYVTLSNIVESDIQRIIDQQLSPLYVSVHATEETLRTRLLGRPSPEILPLLHRLTEAGIEIHTQIVVCPDYNDGAALEQTISDLFAMAPGIRSLAVVPVGLTGHRERLPELRVPDQGEADAILRVVEHWQQQALQETGRRFVFAADEIYLKAGVEFPQLDDYEDLPQIENGVGQVVLFREQAQQALLEADQLQLPVSVSTFTGVSFYPELQQFLNRLAEATTCRVGLFEVENRFFSGEVTVAGLLTGRDILQRLRGEELGEALLVPDVVLRDGEEVFLDDMTLETLALELGLPCIKIPSTPFGVLDALEELSEGAS